MPINYEKTTSTLKTPEEYGIPVLQKMYNTLRDQWFEENGNYMGVEFPDEVDFTFGDSQDHLGMFKANVQYRTNQSGGILRMTSTDYEIEFSNRFRLTPIQLMNVMAHEMIHLLLTVVITKMANDTVQDGEDFLITRQDAEDEMSHGDEFKKLASEINHDLGLKVTVTNDQPIIQNDGTAQVTPGAKVAHLLVTPADNQGELSVLGMSDTRLKKAVMELSARGMPFRIMSTRESHVIVKYAPYDDADKIVTNTVTEDYLAELEEAGVIKDTTKDFMDKTGEFVPGKLLCVTDGGEVRVTRCTDDTAAANALTIAKATGNPVGIYGVTDIYDDDVAVQSAQFSTEDWKDYTLHSDDYTMQQMVDDGSLLPEAEVSPDGSVEEFNG